MLPSLLRRGPSDVAEHGGSHALSLGGATVGGDRRNIDDEQGHFRSADPAGRSVAPQIFGENLIRLRHEGVPVLLLEPRLLQRGDQPIAGELEVDVPFVAADEVPSPSIRSRGRQRVQDGQTSVEEHGIEEGFTPAGRGVAEPHEDEAELPAARKGKNRLHVLGRRVAGHGKVHPKPLEMLDVGQRRPQRHDIVQPPATQQVGEKMKSSLGATALVERDEV